MQDQQDKVNQEETQEGSDFDSAFAEAALPEEERGSETAKQSQEEDKKTDGTGEGVAGQQEERAGETTSKGDDDALKARLAELERKEAEREASQSQTQDAWKNAVNFDDDEELKTFFEDYDHIANPFMKIIERTISARDQQYQKAVQEMQEGFAKNLASTMITYSHPDFYALRDSGAFKKFIEESQGPEREEFQRVYERGTVREIVEFVNTYKERTAPRSKQDAGVSDLEAVRTKRTAVNPNARAGGAISFEDAFDEALSKSTRR